MRGTRTREGYPEELSGARRPAKHYESAAFIFGATNLTDIESERTPASYCGVVGFKPTYGRVSIRGIIALVWSLDHCGPLARTVEDAAMLLQQIAGYDRLDISSVDAAVPDYAAAIGAPVSAFRIGIPPQFYDNLEDDVARTVEDAAVILNKMTRGSREVRLPSPVDAGLGPGFGLTFAESYAYHERLIAEMRGGYEPQTLRIFERGAQIKASDYVRGWRELQLIRRTVDDVFQDVDVLVTPTRRSLPFSPAARANSPGAAKSHTRARQHRREVFD